MNIKYINIIFFAMVVSLIFNNIPEIAQRNLLGGLIGNKLVFYPLFLGIIVSIYLSRKNELTFTKINYLRNFIIIYSCIILINLINGLVNYPYYDILLNGPLDQIEKVPKVIAILKGMGIEIGYNLIFSVWLVLRPFKGFLFEVLYCYGGAYLIFCWYVNDPKKGFKILVDSVGISILFIFIYSYLIEVPYLAGNSFSKNVLAAINPYIHVVEKNGLWWPPLLWNNQLRSVFVEPSYFGIYASFAVPILWYRIIKSRVVLWAPITCLMTFLLFLTKSRTSFLLHLGELLAFVIIGLFVLKIKEYSKR